MARGKSINLFLMDGDANGRIKCTLANWTGIAYKIPRIDLDKCKERDDLKQSVTRTIKQYNITIHAHAKQTAEGFVVLSGSTVSPKDDNTIHPGVKQKRKNAKVDEDHILQEDVLFNSPSSAAMFVIGKSANGWTSWKTKDGKTLHDLED